MTPTQLMAAYSRQDFLQEIHHLLWIAPLVNRGVADQGWNCRDHAFVLAGLAAIQGFKSALLFGSAAFVQGENEGTPPIGLTQDTHAWVGVDQVGFFDLSVRLSGVQGLDGWKDWGVDALCGEGFVPHGKVEWQNVVDAAQYENRINAATHRTGVNTAIYIGKTYSDLSTYEIENAVSCCNSPLTDLLKEKFGHRQDFYAKAIVHLDEFRHGKAATLTGVSQFEAWARLVERPGNAIYRVCTRGRLPVRKVERARA
jgi:hypothetical protein